MIVNLKEAIAGGLKCSPGKVREEFPDSGCSGCVSGLYGSATAANPGQATLYYRKRIAGKLKHFRLGDTATLTLGEARKMASAIALEIAVHGTSARCEEKTKKEDMTYSDFFENHFAPFKKQRLRSWVSCQSIYDNRLRKAFGSMAMKSIRREDIDKFQSSLLASGLSPATCDRHIQLLKTSLKLACSWDMLDKSPAQHVSLYRVENTLDDHLNFEKMKKLLAVLQADHNRPVALIAMFLLSTGCRLNEVLSATWSQIDRENRRMVIPSSRSKSKKPRLIVLSDSAIDILNQLGESEKLNGHIFLSMRSGKRLTNIDKAWRRMRAAAGLTVRLHGLRHTYASCMINSGRTLYDVQVCLGHSSPTVTQKYAHMSSKSMQAAANCVSDVIKDAMQVESV